MAGILFRFAYANVLPARAVKALITKTPAIQCSGNRLYDSWHLPSDWGRFASRIGMSDAMVRLALLGDLLEGLRWTPVLSQALRFCPDCLRFGYHARYFQITALAACPVHGTPLRDTCPGCGAPTPFYGICNDLFSRIYCCPRCNAHLAGQGVSIRTFFEPGVTSEQLQDVWMPLDDWINALDGLELGFATLRDWVTEDAGKYETERCVDALHIVDSVLPLPKGRFSWREPSLRRRSFSYFEGDRRPRLDPRLGSYLGDAYVHVKQGIEKRLIEPRLSEVIQRCRKEEWGAFANNATRKLNAREVAYVLWRMKFENLSDPALLLIDNARAGVCINDSIVPFPWWNLGQPAWKVLFWATYRGLLFDVEREIQSGGYVADLLRGSPTRHCCFLPSTSLHRNGRGIAAYPMPLFRSSLGQ